MIAKDPLKILSAYFTHSRFGRLLETISNKILTRYRTENDFNVSN